MTFKVNVLYSQNMILLELRNSWSFCYQNLFHGTSSQAGMSSENLLCYVQGLGHSAGSTLHWMFVQVVSSDLFNSEPFVVKPKSVLRKDCFATIKVRDTISYNKNIVSTISTEVLIFLQPNLVWWYITSWKDWITVFRVSVTVMVQHITECLSVLYFLVY